MVYVFLATGFEEVEAITIIDLLRRAEINTKTVSIENSLEITGAHNIKIMADVFYDDIEEENIDMMILPGGGLGTENLKKHRGLSKLLIKQDKDNNKIAAICAAPSVLGKLNILEDKKAVCYPGFENELFGAEITKEKVQVSDNIITSLGVGTAILFALELIKQLKNDEIKEKIRKEILFN